jgi:hypothetical protein
MTSAIKGAFTGLAMLTLAGCADAPDSGATKNELLQEAQAQGGVCIGQTFPVLLHDRSYALARAISQSDTGVVLQVQTHRPSKGSDIFSRGDSSYNGHVVVSGFPLKPAEECTVKPGL